jgi:predicted cupin superfamily sugar epimerase
MGKRLDPGGSFPVGLSPDEAIKLLGLEPHPEGGHYREIYRHADPSGGRGAVTSIYYLLKAGETSAWHRIDAVEIWHYYAGAPLALTVVPEGGKRTAYHLGIDLAAGQQPQAIVPVRAWQSAVSLGRWSLMGCTVAPAFSFEGFELAPEGWKPGR